MALWSSYLQKFRSETDSQDPITMPSYTSEQLSKKQKKKLKKQYASSQEYGKRKVKCTPPKTVMQELRIILAEPIPKNFKNKDDFDF